MNLTPEQYDMDFENFIYNLEIRSADKESFTATIREIFQEWVKETGVIIKDIEIKKVSRGIGETPQYTFDMKLSLRQSHRSDST